jgi:hypothetical protein
MAENYETVRGRGRRRRGRRRGGRRFVVPRPGATQMTLALFSSMFTMFKIKIKSFKIKFTQLFPYFVILIESNVLYCI